MGVAGRVMACKSPCVGVPLYLSVCVRACVVYVCVTAVQLLCVPHKKSIVLALTKD